MAVGCLTEAKFSIGDLELDQVGNFKWPYLPE